MDVCEVTAEELLGPLNDVEQKNAPARLFIAGDAAILREGGRVAIVGSRKASRDGISRAKKLAKLLVERNMVVVSGLAEGIDTAAHTGTLEAGGRTIAVIGTPLDKVYPRQNAELQHRIIEEHLLVSQFPIGYPTNPANFPQRNRTMALIADATVIIEATDSSGSWRPCRALLGTDKGYCEGSDRGAWQPSWSARTLRLNGHCAATKSSDSQGSDSGR